MKKIIALTLVLILAVGLFAGCKSSDKGSVYFLNFKPEADSAWQALAKTYTEKTGVTVKVVTAASGTFHNNCNTDLRVFCGGKSCKPGMTVPLYIIVFRRAGLSRCGIA